MSQQYVAGFMFSADQKQVALIKKNRPTWQKGLLNAIGGHIEESDCNALAAMVREFTEETGCSRSAWTAYARISEDNEFAVTFYYALGDLSKLKTTTDEEVIIVDIADIARHETIENLPWLIPLALDCLNDGRPEWTEVNYPKRKESSK